MARTSANEDWKPKYFHKLREMMQEDHRSAIVNALYLTVETFRSYNVEMEKVATCLRAGSKVAMFADGEPGARAADAMAENFIRRANEALELAEDLES
jgi:hypothetical protein